MGSPSQLEEVSRMLVQPASIQLLRYHLTSLSSEDYLFITVEIIKLSKIVVLSVSKEAS